MIRLETATHPPRPPPTGKKSKGHYRSTSNSTIVDLKMALASSEFIEHATIPPIRRMSPQQLRHAPVLTIVGLKIQCSLEYFIPLGRLVGAGILIRDRMDAVNLVFRDEETRKQAFRTLESDPARELLDEYSQYDFYYVAWRPQADIAFYQIEPLDEPVFDEKRRIYLEDEFKPLGFEFGPTNAMSFTLADTTEVPAPDPTLLEITSINAFFAKCEPPRTPLVCPACRRLYAYIP